MPFLPPNQQRRSTEGTKQTIYINQNWIKGALHPTTQMGHNTRESPNKTLQRHILTKISWLQCFSLALHCVIIGFFSELVDKHLLTTKNTIICLDKNNNNCLCVWYGLSSFLWQNVSYKQCKCLLKTSLLGSQMTTAHRVWLFLYTLQNILTNCYPITQK